MRYVDEFFIWWITKIQIDGGGFNKWIMFHGHLDYLKIPPLGGRPSTKPGDHGTPNAQNYWFVLFYHVWGPAWIKIHQNSIWLRPQSHMTSHHLRVRNQTTWFWRYVVMACGHFLLGSHNFMVTALGSCVNWPLVSQTHAKHRLQLRCHTII